MEFVIGVFSIPAFYMAYILIDEYKAKKRIEKREQKKGRD